MLAAGDFLTCWGEERGPRGEKAACEWAAALENGVDTGGVAPASCEGVLPCWDCWEERCLLGVGVDIVVKVSSFHWRISVQYRRQNLELKLSNG